jgi:hypothetical protein
MGLTVGVLNPHPAPKRSRVLSADANFFKQIHQRALAAAQLPPTLTDSRETFLEPSGW